MKVLDNLLIVLLSLYGFASAAFQGTEEEFLNTIASGKVPEGILPGALPHDPYLRRKLEKVARHATQRCRKNSDCSNGLECVGSKVGSFCMPTECVETVIAEFIEEEEFENYPQRMMALTGYIGKPIINETTTQSGWSGIATNGRHLLKEDFQQSMAQHMKANPIPMRKLLNRVIRRCPAAAAQHGLTVMVGFRNELANVSPKMFHNFYFALGTADMEVIVDSSVQRINATGGIYSDACGFIGQNAGTDLGVTAGALFSGTVAKLQQSSFVFDIEAIQESDYGAVIGVTSKSSTQKLMFMNVGEEEGAQQATSFSGCSTHLLSQVNFGS